MRSALAVLLAVALVSVADAAPKRRSPPKPKWPDLSTQANRMRMMEYVGTKFENRATRPIGYRAADLDADLNRFLDRNTSTRRAGVISDEAFLRRLSLDLIGRVPTLPEIDRFVGDTDPDKRDKKVDQLLQTDAWARKQGRYWRSVIFHNSPGITATTNPKATEDWLTEQFRAGRGWDQIVAEMLVAVPTRKKGVANNKNAWDQDSGYKNFILSSNREPEHLASRTARIFMGISIECAECHDHPFEDWEREQFHELAAFFAPNRYYMDDEEDPSERHRMQPRFLLGEKPPENLTQQQRRVVLAAYLVYNPDNYWFARSYVNRIWSELMGDGFYAVDSLGPDKEIIHQLIVNKMAAQFRAEGFDSRWLFRLICQSDAYQREAKPVGEDVDLFTSVRATRLRPWEVLDRLKSLGGQAIAKNRGLARSIAQVFEQDPSTPHKSLEGTVQQALLMMNQYAINEEVRKSALMKSLKNLDDDAQVIERAFLGVLARKPSEEEARRYERFLDHNGGDRGQAIEDIVWVLMNSAEFLTKT